jgi:hypothetical protein
MKRCRPLYGERSVYKERTRDERKGKASSYFIKWITHARDLPGEVKDGRLLHDKAVC